MSDPVKLPAIFSGIRSRKDRSYNLSFDTRELGGEHAAILLGMQQTECWLLVAPSEGAIDRADVPVDKPDAGTAKKTASQRLRACLYVYYRQLGSVGEFESFYNAHMERFIDTVKSHLDSGEVR